MTEVKTSQRIEVARYLKKNKSITSMEAFEKFGATRLSAIIFDLRKQGYVIDTVMTEGKNRYGGTVRYGKYVLKNSPKLAPKAH